MTEKKKRKVNPWMKGFVLGKPLTEAELYTSLTKGEIGNRVASKKSLKRLTS